LSEESPSCRFSTKTLYAFLLSPMHATCHAHLILLYFINLIIFSKDMNYKTPHNVVFSSLLLHPPSWVHIFSSAPYSLKHPQYSLFPLHIFNQVH
jgi:hypothetical protein